MNKVIIIGCPGAGKTTFANKLNKATHLPLYHLDAIWHKPDKTTITREEFSARLTEIFSTSHWIIDGNYNRTMEIRFQNCDTVFLFDLPVDVCLQGVNERIGIHRSDMPWVANEPDIEFEKFIREFPDNSLPRIYDLIKQYKDEKQVIIFKSREEADEYINKLRE